VVPNALLRRSALGLGALFALGSSAALVLAPLPPRAYQGLVAGFASFLVIILVLGIYSATLAAAAQVREPERRRLLFVAPIPTAAAIWLPVGSIMAAALIPVGLLFLPYAAATLRFAPIGALGLALAGCTVLLWSVQFSLGFVTLLVARLGREKGSQLAKGLIVLPVVFVSLPGAVLLRVDAGVALLVLVAGSFAVLPFSLPRTARKLLRQLTEGEPAELAPEPPWGSPRLWGRLLVRSSAPWSAVGAAVFAVMLTTGRLPWPWGMAALVLTTLATVPLAHLIAPEHSQLDRWRLAPERAAVVQSMLTWVVLPAVGLEWAIVFLVGRGSWGWVGGVAVLILAAALSPLVMARVPRYAIQFACCVLAMATELLR
jgi:hypothetical protein